MIFWKSLIFPKHVSKKVMKSKLEGTYSSYKDVATKNSHFSGHAPWSTKTYHVMSCARSRSHAKAWCAASFFPCNHWFSGWAYPALQDEPGCADCFLTACVSTGMYYITLPVLQYPGRQVLLHQRDLFQCKCKAGRGKIVPLKIQGRNLLRKSMPCSFMCLPLDGAANAADFTG